MDWRLLLRAAIRGGLRFAAGHADVSYARPSRRSAAAPNVVLPVLRRPLPTVAVVLDTSGSVTAELLDQALTEVDGALRSVAVRGSEVTVLCCDAAAYPPQRVSAARRIDVLGGGGTDLRVGIAAALQVRPRPDLVLVLTDGEPPWPAVAPRGTRLIVVLLAAPSEPPPDWAAVVHAYQ